MAGRVDPRDSPVLLTVIPNTAQSLKGVYNKDTDSNDKISVANEIIQYQGDLPGLKDGTTIMNPRSATSGRFDFDELKTEGITVSGDYVLAITDIASTNRYASYFLITVKDNSVTSSYVIIVACSNRAGTKTHLDTTVKYLAISNPSTTEGLKSINLLCGNLNGSGYKLVADLAVNVSLDISIQKLGNIADTMTGWKLIPATTTDNTKTPDGVVADAVLEAGAFYDISSTVTETAPLICRKASNDLIRMWIRFPVEMKVGTNFAINILSGTIRFTDGVNISANLSGFSIVSPVWKGRDAHFAISQTGIATALTSSVIFMEVINAEANISISG